MKVINNKGVTLIELLAVVVILLAISVIAVSSISSAIERNKAKQNATKMEVIISHARLYYEDHRNTLEPSGCIQIIALDLNDSERLDADGEPFDGYIKYTNGSDFKYSETCS